MAEIKELWTFKETLRANFLSSPLFAGSERGKWVELRRAANPRGLDSASSNRGASGLGPAGRAGLAAYISSSLPRRRLFAMCSNFKFNKLLISSHHLRSADGCCECVCACVCVCVSVCVRARAFVRVTSPLIIKYLRSVLGPRMFCKLPQPFHSVNRLATWLEPQTEDLGDKGSIPRQSNIFFFTRRTAQVVVTSSREIGKPGRGGGGWIPFK